MKNNIFVKIKNKKRFSQALLYMCLLCGFLLFSCMSVYAYFTAKASEKGDISFGTIEVNLLDSSGNAMSATSMASQYLSNIVPGQQIQLSNINVKNSETHDEYVLIN